MATTLHSAPDHDALHSGAGHPTKAMVAPKAEYDDTQQLEMHMISGEYEQAVAGFTTAINTFRRADVDCQKPHAHLGVLHCNRALAHLKLKQWFPAMLDAKAAIEQDPALTKAHHTLAQAQLGLGRFKAAMQSARGGERLLNLKADRTTDFTILMDQIAMAGALKGDYAAFDGRVLQVRSAGEDAWLCKPAPEDPTLDGPSTPSASPLQLQDGHSDQNAKQLAPLSAPSQALATETGSQRRSYRSIKDAVEAAQSGDQIILQPGVHNGLGETVNITKRILIRGCGRKGQTKIDQRANCPTFRITHSAVIMDLEIDMTGFREAVLITGTDRVCPAIQNCSISCSGNDGINVTGEAQPTISGCVVSGQKCGLRASRHSSSRVHKCVVWQCGEQACKASDAAVVHMTDCLLENNKEECIVGMGNSTVNLVNCNMQSSGGPAIDMTGTSVLHVNQGSIQDCVGGIWMWDHSSCELDRLQLQGGSSYAMFTDAGCQAQLKGCWINGSLHMNDKAWQSIQVAQDDSADKNRFVAPKAPVYWPLEDGPFLYESTGLTAS